MVLGSLYIDYNIFSKSLHKLGYELFHISSDCDEQEEILSLWISQQYFPSIVTCLEYGYPLAEPRNGKVVDVTDDLVESLTRNKPDLDKGFLGQMEPQGNA